MENYRNIREELNTGDVVLFAGKGFVSGIVKFFSRSKWSHVGIIVKSNDLNMVLIWESTGLSKVKDMDTGEIRIGVQTVTLSDRLDEYKGEVWVRQYDGRVTKKMIGILAEFRRESKGKPYEKNYWQLAKSLLDFSWLRPNKRDVSSLFCSELVAESLQRMGLMTNDLPSNEFTPRDFEDGGPFEKYWAKGVTFKKAVQLK
jgi:hypothetical protein